MFIARNQQGEQINLLSFSKKDIELFENKSWYCPSCHLPVTLKNGPIKLSHFSHQRKTTCDNYRGGETGEHLKGKSLIANWCQENQLKYQLEAYLPEIKQRADLLIEDSIVIEIQCSEVSVAELRERTKGYEAHGYQVYWLMGSRFFIDNKLSVVQRASISYSCNVGFYFWELDTKGEELRLIFHIEALQGQRGFCYKGRSWQVQEMPLLDILAFPKVGKIFSYRQFDNHSSSWDYYQLLGHKLTKRDKKTLKVQESLYLKGKHLMGLDVIYFVPATEPLIIKESILLWRIIFWEQLIKVKNKSLVALKKRILKGLIEGDVACYEMPLVSGSVHFDLFFYEYLNLLLGIGYLSLEGEVLIIKKTPQEYKSGDNRLEMTNKLLKDYKQISATPYKNML